MFKGNFVVAIDGPAGAGKSTIAKLVARKLVFAYIDTGAMYRSVTWKFLRTKAEFNENFIGELANKIRIDFRTEENKVFVDGTDVTEAIRTTAVTNLVSRISAINTVRIAMVAEQRRMGESGRVVLDGRDIGTVVFPNADVKIFLTATVEERALRRYKEMTEKGMAVSLKQLQEAILNRDKQDSEREISPLRQAKDAVFLDTSNMCIDEITDFIINLVRGKEHDLRRS
ncbi:MAG: (d)CMP kinase [Phascolarctobacterium sp.]|nr:(d)CMP kinase [Phascolarctobacterium sp.]